MSPEQFLEQFGHLAEAPNGIAKLRELILQLAVQGKLVPQDPNDEPASVLLEKIKAEKERLVKEGKIKKGKPLSAIETDEMPFDLPSSWIWLRVESVFYPISVSKNKVKTSEIQTEGKIPVVDQGQSFISGYIDKADLEIAIPGPVIVFGDHTTALKYVDFNFVAGADGVKILRPLGCDERYFFLVAKTLPIDNRGYGRHYRRLVDNLFPLPPLAEQSRIVAKVDQLMALCDALEAKQNTRTETHGQLIRAAHHPLAEANQPEQLRPAWQRINNHFDQLYNTTEAVNALRQTILQLAVQGKLVPQDPNDEPASVLLEKIKAEKATLVKEGIIKQKKRAPEIEKADEPHELPNSWSWVPLDHLVSIMDAGWSPACPSEPSPSNDIWGVLKTTAVQTLEYWENENKVLPHNKTPRPQYEVKSGDILITRAGPKNRVAISCLVEETRPRLMISDKIIRFHLAEAGLSERFISLCLNAGATARHLEKSKSGMAESQMNISQDKLRLSPIPLPPVNEQSRIVAKVDQLMALCNELEAKIVTKQTTAERFAAAATYKFAAA